MDECSHLSQDFQGIKGNAALKAAQDTFLDTIGKLKGNDRKSFMEWCHNVESCEALAKIPTAPAPPSKANKPPAYSTPSGSDGAKPVDVRSEFNENLHVGVKCDVSGVMPVVGNRWKKIDENYDLCQAEFDKLNPEEQANFVCLAGGEPSIRIMSPKQGTQWPMGSIQQIEWESTGTISAVKIQYAEKSYTSWLYDWSELAISGRTDGRIPNTGKCRWRVPAEGIKPGTKMYFRITAEQQEDPNARSLYVDSGLFEVTPAEQVIVSDETGKTATV